MTRKTRKQRGEQAHWCELRSLCFLNAAPAPNLADVKESHAVVTSAVSIGESSSLVYLSLLIWVWKLLLIKVSKGEMKRRRNWAAWAALFPLCMVAAQAEVFRRPQGLAEVAGDVATVAQGQGRNHSPLTGFKELGNYTQVAKWIDVSACQQFLQKNRGGLWEGEEGRATPYE